MYLLEKRSCVSGPLQFTPVFFKGQLYFIYFIMGFSPLHIKLHKDSSYSLL